MMKLNQTWNQKISICLMLTIALLLCFGSIANAVELQNTLVLKLIQETNIFQVANTESNMQTFTFTEDISEFNNPDIGFYRPTGIACKVEGEWPTKYIQYPGGLVHLRIGLKAFSGKANNVQDYDITQEHIEKLNGYMDQIRQAGGTAIVRFAYDDFNGNANLEPDISKIIEHIEQLKPFFEQNEDIIASVESGFLGPWGEQHTSTVVTRENIKKVVEKLLEVVPDSRTVSVRKPDWYCAVTGTNIDEIDKDITVVGTNAYRIGIFNDGYLGSASDLGTFKNREKELAWLNRQATHTIYGGEAVSAGIKDTDKNGNLYNSPEHIQEEMFVTHTSYLNEEWNYSLITSWKETKYAGTDEAYQGQSVYTYVKNHLGYRFILQESNVPQTMKQKEDAQIHVKIENVGAGNVVNEKKAYIVLKNETNEYTIPISLDVRNWYSRQIQDIDIFIPIDLSMQKGDYDIYLKIVDKGEEGTENKRAIRFASEDVWNKDLGANKIGTTQIVEASKEPIEPVEPEYIYGDIDIDGKVTINDLAKLKLHCIEKELLVGKNLEAADLDKDNRVSINDLAMLKLMLIEK